MTERAYRFYLGVLLSLVLFLELPELYYAYAGLLLAEGLLPWRVPTLVTRLRFGAEVAARNSKMAPSGTIPFAAERAMRLTFGLIMVLTFFVLPTPYWFVNWCIAISLLLSGLVNVCPLVLFYRSLGFR